tara:strand:- start:46 stop:780 length:735 start_codon:yes stop_codon:yes gene_type:complete
MAFNLKSSAVNPLQQVKDPPSKISSVISTLLGSHPVVDAGKALLGLAKNRIAGNIRPQGYHKPLSRVASALGGNAETGSANGVKTNFTQRAFLKERQDFLGLMMNGKQPNNTLPTSSTKPSNSKDKNAVYYNSPETENAIKEKLKDTEFLKSFKPNKKGVYSTGTKFHRGPKVEVGNRRGNVLGNFAMNLGEDDKGKYVSYYDKWDLDPYKGKNKVLNTMSSIAQDVVGVKPAEAYGRVYYNKK